MHFHNPCDSNRDVSCLNYRSDHLSKHIKTHTKNRGGSVNSGADGSINSTKIEIDEKLIKTEMETAEAMCTDDDDDGGDLGDDQDQDDQDGDGDGDADGDCDGDEQEQETEEMMITINTEGEQPELIINDSSIETQS